MSACSFCSRPGAIGAPLLLAGPGAVRRIVCACACCARTLKPVLKRQGVRLREASERQGSDPEFSQEREEKQP